MDWKRRWEGCVACYWLVRAKQNLLQKPHINFSNNWTVSLCFLFWIRLTNLRDCLQSCTIVFAQCQQLIWWVQCYYCRNDGYQKTQDDPFNFIVQIYHDLQQSWRYESSAMPSDSDQLEWWDETVLYPEKLRTPNSPMTAFGSVPKAHTQGEPEGTWNLEKLHLELKYLGRKLADAKLQREGHTSNQDTGSEHKITF